MQMFGIGIPELLVILLLSVLVVGPERLPQFAADLARWIRQARAYATHLTKDFNAVMSDLEKEAGATREDWKEIASVVGLHTGDVVREVQKVAGQIESSTSIERTKPEPANVVPFEATGRQTNAPPLSIATGEAPVTDESEPRQNSEERPWYVPERTARRRATDS